MSIGITIADEVVALLNDADAGTFSEAFTARKRFVPTFTLATAGHPNVADLSTMRIEAIVPPVQTVEKSDRSIWIYDVPIALAMAKKLAEGDDDARETEAETLTDFVETIIDYLMDDTRMELASEATLDRIDPYQNINPEAFSEQQEFFASVVLHYQLYR